MKRGLSFTRYMEVLAELLSARVGLVDSLRYLAGLDPRALGVLERAAAGGSVPGALTECYGPVAAPYESLVGLGVDSGTTAEVVAHLARFLRADADASRRLAGAAAYPAFVLLLLAAGLLVIRFSVLPTLLLELPAGAGGSDVTPALIEVVVGLVSVFFALGVGILLATRLPGGAGGDSGVPSAGAAVRAVVGRLLDLAPLVRRRRQLRVAFVLRVWLEAGGGLAEGVDYARRAVSGTRLAGTLAQVGARLASGASAGEAFALEGTGELAFWAGVADQTGDAAGAFALAERFLATRYASAVERTLRLAEPLLISFVGLVLLAVTALVILPLLSLLQGVAL